jgi:DNA-binding response OmpR family regulator
VTLQLSADLHLPGLGGDEMVRRLRGKVQTSLIPVIVLTGPDEQNADVRLMDAGADDYIRKPIDPHDSSPA